jgi:hypothetical protein
VVIMAAIALGVNEAFGLERGSNISRGMLLVLTYSASVFDKTIIAGAATITARGAMERFGHVEVLYSRWLLAYLPVDLVAADAEVFPSREAGASRRQRIPQAGAGEAGHLEAS